MTDRELMQMALDALENAHANEPIWKTPIKEAIEALRARLAQHEPEPVAWRGSNWSLSPDNYVYRDYDDPLLNIKGENVGEPLYTAPPKKEWVDLTEEEIEDLTSVMFEEPSNEEVIDFASRVQAKLKEKNSD